MAQRAGTPAFVARAAELAALRAAVERAASGVASAVIVSGEAGVGKSRIVEELMGTARESSFRSWPARMRNPTPDPRRSVGRGCSSCEALLHFQRALELPERVAPDAGAGRRPQAPWTPVSWGAVSRAPARPAAPSRRSG